MKKLLAAVLAVFFIVSCSKDSEKSRAYVVKIDGVTIIEKDLQTEMASLPEMTRELFQGPEGASRFVDEIIKKEVLYLEAKKRGMEKDKDLQKKLEEIKKLTLINQLLEKEIKAAAKVTETDIKDYYNKNKDNFIIPNQVRLSHIVLKTEDDAKKAYERLNKGEDFAKVASELSIDKASAKSGGDIGSFKMGEMSAEIENIVFKLKKGEISEPARLKDGIHIFKATDLKGSQVEFSKVKDLIAQRLTAEKQREAFDKFIEGIKKNYKIDINKDAVSKINLEQGSRSAEK